MTGWLRRRRGKVFGIQKLSGKSISDQVDIDLAQSKWIEYINTHIENSAE
jgi:hypothetical protein